MSLRVWVAAGIAASVAIVNNFAWNEMFTFPETHRASPSWGTMLRRCGTFALISGAGLLLNVAVVEFLVAILHLPWLPGVSAGVILAGAWNFFANANLTWRPDPKKRLAQADEGLEMPQSSQPAIEKIK